jgi:arylsulfatase A-like enzyme
MSAAKRPRSVLLIVADDLGFSDVGCYGSEIHTPNLDRLAAGGARLTHFYNCARCCPSRASLLTGLYPHQAGVGHMVRNWHVPGYEGFLNTRCVTLAEVLRGAGYATGMSGKWHVGGRITVDRATWTPGTPEHPTPRQRGFDRYFGVMTGGGSYFQPHALMVDDELVEDSDERFYYTDAIAENAIDMLDDMTEQDRPFFLYVAFTAPHWPLHALPKDIDTYRDAYMDGWDVARRRRHEQAVACGVVDPSWTLPPSDVHAPSWAEVPDKEWQAARMAVYAAQVDRMDQRIGDLVEALTTKGRLDDTLVLFFSDNGACAEELRPGDQSMSQVPESTRDGGPIVHGNVPGVMPGGPDTFMSYGLPWAQVSNTPFRRYKSWAHEGGVSTPFIAHCPDLIAPGLTAHSVGHVIDLMPTILELTGADYPLRYGGNDIQPLEGQSLLPVLAGRTERREGALCWEHEGKRAVRTDRWKLVAMHQGPWELYDMSNDRTECDDLATAEPGVVAELSALYAAWAERIGVASWDAIEVEQRRTDEEDRVARELRTPRPG